MTRENRLYRGVADQMREGILSGAYPAGGRLPPERELAQQFSVSRPTVREAIIALEAQGCVKIKSGSGVYVLPQGATKGDEGQSTIIEGSAFELTEARALLEGEAAALAAAAVALAPCPADREEGTAVAVAATAMASAPASGGPMGWRCKSAKCPSLLGSPAPIPAASWACGWCAGRSTVPRFA